MIKSKKMKPIYIEVDSNLPLMIVPESAAHMDGHPVLTYSYAIYKDVQTEKDHRFTDTDALLTPKKKNDPNYLGTLTFEQPGRIFSYEADGGEELPRGAIEQVIEQITHYRENPALWTI
jgi:hypothetical protein